MLKSDLKRVYFVYKPWKPGKVQQNLSYQLKRMSILELRKVLFLQKVQREGGEEESANQNHIRGHPAEGQKIL